jgi:rhodanese-related sulfurtransferase
VGVPLTSVDDLLERARSTITRLTPAEAYAASLEGAVLVDLRSGDEQREQGVLVPGAHAHPLSVALWRLEALPRETTVILLCRHGYSSSFAAAQLRELGFDSAGDVIGGVDAWQAAGLPVEPVSTSRVARTGP